MDDDTQPIRQDLIIVDDMEPGISPNPERVKAVTDWFESGHVTGANMLPMRPGSLLDRLDMPDIGYIANLMRLPKPLPDDAFVTKYMNIPPAPDADPPERPMTEHHVIPGVEPIGTKMERIRATFEQNPIVSRVVRALKTARPPVDADGNVPCGRDHVMPMEVYAQALQEQERRLFLAVDPAHGPDKAVGIVAMMQDGIMHVIGECRDVTFTEEERSSGHVSMGSFTLDFPEDKVSPLLYGGLMRPSDFPFYTLSIDHHVTIKLPKRRTPRPIRWRELAKARAHKRPWPFRRLSIAELCELIGWDANDR